ncbi:MAG: glycosyltransferase family 4 protein [Kiritimatiellia bacterium]
MRILHLVSNFRWTERIEPAADLAIAQRQLGHDVRYACGHNKGAPPEDCIQGRAARKGLVFDDRFVFDKHFRPLSAWKDLARLNQYIADFRPDVVHCHLPNDHMLAALAIRHTSPRPLLVRTLYEPDGPQWPLRYKFISSPPTDGLILVTEQTRPRTGPRFAERPDRVAVLVPGIDVDEFDGRRDLGKLDHVAGPAGSFVAGMVTSINQRRRVDLALEAVALLAPRHPRLRLLIAGRGKVDVFVWEPARRLGIADRILLPGYCRNDDLVRAYHTMDALLYPFHGTDQSCRTVREALASGFPVVASALGIVPDLVKDGETGFLSEFNAPALAGALEKLLRLDPARRARMAAQATADARARFSRTTQARLVLEFYERLRRLRTA